MDLWNLPAAGFNLLPDVSLRDDAVQYPNCDNSSVGSVVLVNTRLDTATVAYYIGITRGSTACFVCHEDSGYELNATNVRVCQIDGTWSGNPIVCGTLLKC